MRRNWCGKTDVELGCVHTMIDESFPYRGRDLCLLDGDGITENRFVEGYGMRSIHDNGSRGYGFAYRKTSVEALINVRI